MQSTEGAKIQRFDFYFGQLVRQEDLDNAFDGAEQADRSLILDFDSVGINSGLDVTEAGVPNLTVQVFSGRGYDQQGRRVAVPSTQIVDLTASIPVGLGNNRISSVVAVFERDLSDPRVDDNAVNILYNQAESFDLVIVDGNEVAGIPVAPAKPANGLVLADVTLTEGQVSIVNANIDTTTDGRRDHAFELLATLPSQVKAGTLPEVTQLMLNQLNTHISGVANEHQATAVSFDNSGIPAQLTNLAAATEVQEALDAVAGDLEDTELTRFAQLLSRTQPAVASWPDDLRYFHAVTYAEEGVVPGGGGIAVTATLTDPTAVNSAQILFADDDYLLVEFIFGVFKPASTDARLLSGSQLFRRSGGSVSTVGASDTQLDITLGTLTAAITVAGGVVGFTCGGAIGDAGSPVRFAYAVRATRLPVPLP